MSLHTTLPWRVRPLFTALALLGLSATLTMTSCVREECSADSECEEGERCSAAGLCTPRAEECSSDTDCLNGFRCDPSSNQCVAVMDMNPEKEMGPEDMGAEEMAPDDMGADLRDLTVRPDMADMADMAEEDQAGGGCTADSAVRRRRAL